MKTCKNCQNYNDETCECEYNPNFSVSFDHEPCVYNRAWRQRVDENGMPIECKEED